LVRHIGSAPEREAVHAPLPIAARWFPKPQRLETAAGMHRVAWTLSWNTSDDVSEDEPDDGEGGVPRPPRVPPGDYTVELRVNGETVSTVPLVLLEDPRSAASPAQLAAQFATGVSIFSDSLACRRALAEIAAVNERLTQALVAPGGRTNRTAASTKVLRQKLAGLVEGGSGLATANSELTSALNVVESSDRPVPAQALAVYELARTASQAKLAQWATLKAGPLAKLTRGDPRYRARSRLPHDALRSAPAAQSSPNCLKSTPSARSLRYRCVRSMPTRFASWPTLPLHSCSCCCK
jgi:hypothetical protein